MPNIVEYAQFAANAYARSLDVVKDANAISVPSGWQELTLSETSNNKGVNTTTGFLARAYKNTATGEIVIAYTGTTAEDGMKTVDWMNGNLPAGTGFGLGGNDVIEGRGGDDTIINPGAGRRLCKLGVGGTANDEVWRIAA